MVTIKMVILAGWSASTHACVVVRAGRQAGRQLASQPASQLGRYAGIHVFDEQQAQEGTRGDLLHGAARSLAAVDHHHRPSRQQAAPTDSEAQEGEQRYRCALRRQFSAPGAGGADSMATRCCRFGARARNLSGSFARCSSCSAGWPIARGRWAAAELPAGHYCGVTSVPAVGARSTPSTPSTPCKLLRTPGRLTAAVLLLVASRDGSPAGPASTVRVGVRRRRCYH